MNTSVSALVRDALKGIAGAETEFERLRADEQSLRRRLASRGATFSAARRLNRTEAHERHALR